jgi:hypothetical protein
MLLNGGARPMDGMRHAILALADRGLNLIVDDATHGDAAAECRRLPEPRGRRGLQPMAATSAWRGQLTRWSFTMPTACMKA